MSTKSSLKERLARRVPVQAVSRVASGSPARYRLAPGSATPNTVRGAEALVRRHLTMRQAHRLMTRLLAGESVVVELPMVEDRPCFEAELGRLGIRAIRHEPPRWIDVRLIIETPPE